MMGNVDRRNPEFQREFYSLFRPGNLFLLHQRERAVLRGLEHAGVTRSSIESLRIIEAGCGAGGLLPQLVSYGADPANLSGFDLDETRIAEARHRWPSMRFFTGDVTNVSEPSRSYDVVIQSTLFTSILDAHARRMAARELLRLVRPGGFILWLDFRYNSPRNSAVRGVPRAEIERELFPDASVFITRTMLVPPLARRLVPFSRLACEFLSLVPALLTHYVAVIRPHPEKELDANVQA